MTGMTETLENWWNNKLNTIHTVIPGKIVEYYGHDERKAKVQPMLNLRLAQNKIVEIQPIDDVPVIFPSTAEMGLMFPLQKDDGVLLLFAESPIGEYLDSDDTADVEDLTRFNLSDCIAIPGMWSFKSAPDMGVDENSVAIVYKDSFIEITKDGTLNIVADKDLNIEAGSLTLTSDSTETTIESGSNKIVMGSAGVKINENFEVSA